MMRCHAIQQAAALLARIHRHEAQHLFSPTGILGFDLVFLSIKCLISSQSLRLVSMRVLYVQPRFTQARNKHISLLKINQF